MITIEYTTHGPLAKTYRSQFDERLDQQEVADAVDFYTRARVMGYQPRIVSGGEHFPILPLINEAVNPDRMDAEGGAL
jgi:hypothetical protein